MFLHAGESARLNRSVVEKYSLPSVEKSLQEENVLSLICEIITFPTSAQQGMFILKRSI